MANDVTLSPPQRPGSCPFSAPASYRSFPLILTFIAGTTIEDVATEKVGRARRDIFLAAGPVRCRFSTSSWRLAQPPRFSDRRCALILRPCRCSPVSRSLRWGCISSGSSSQPSVSGKTPRGPKPLGLWGAYVMGLAFAFGWTPCIGGRFSPPSLAIAASGSDSCTWRRPFGDLFARLGIPFLLAAAALGPFLGFLKSVQGTFRRRRARRRRAADV